MFNQLLMLGLLFLFTVEKTYGQEPKKIRIGYPSVSTTQSHIWVGHEAGLFRKYGLEVEPILLRGGQIATQALAAGDPPIVNIGTVVQAGLQGHNLVLVAAVQSSYDFLVFTRPGITKPEQLKGKRLGITGFGSATHFAATLLLRHLNLEPNKDVALVPAGLDPERVAAITAGRIDGSFFTSIAAPLARKANLHELLYIGDLGIEVQGNGLATSRGYGQSQREIVKSAVKGYVEAIHFIFANKKEAQRIFARYMRNDDPQFLELAYQLYVKLIPKKPYPTLKGVQNMLDLLAPQSPQAKSFKPEHFVDLSFLQSWKRKVSSSRWRRDIR